MAVRRKLIRTVATDLINRLGITGPPVPVGKIAQRLGAKIAKAPADDPGLSGFLLRRPAPEGVVIGVNAGHPPVRQRFTVAHELGHLLLHRGQQFHVDRGGMRVFRRDGESAAGTNHAEIEANVFAAELLMPVAFVVADVALQPWVDLADEDALRDMARRYQVSPQAMAFRLSNLGLLQL